MTLTKKKVKEILEKNSHLFIDAELIAATIFSLHEQEVKQWEEALKSLLDVKDDWVHKATEYKKEIEDLKLTIRSNEMSEAIRNSKIH